MKSAHECFTSQARDERSVQAAAGKECKVVCGTARVQIAQHGDARNIRESGTSAMQNRVNLWNRAQSIERSINVGSAFDSAVKRELQMRSHSSNCAKRRYIHSAGAQPAEH